MIVSSLPPSATLPLPDSDWMDVPDVVPEISNVPLAATPLESATEVAPVIFSVAPLLIAVAPVYSLVPASVVVPPWRVRPPVSPPKPMSP